MSYKPMTAEEAATLSLRPKGIYPFDVLDAKDSTSKKGNGMIELTLGFFDETGAQFKVRAWLVHSDSRWAEKTFYDFAQATGLGARYAAGTMVADDCLGKAGFAEIKIVKGAEKKTPQGDGTGEFFPDKNEVAYYLTPHEAEKRKAAAAAKAGAAPAAASNRPTEAQLANQESPKAQAQATNMDEDVPF